MTDTVVIPELHLFSSRRCPHHSPTRDVGFDSYKNTKKTIEYYDKISAERERISAFRQNRYLPPSHIVRQPVPIGYPISVPIPVPVPIPVQEPIEIYDGPLMYPEIDRQFIRAPSTYLNYAEEYLMGRRSAIIPSVPQTARFQRLSPAASRVQQRQKSQIKKDIYLNNNKKEIQPKNPKIIVTPPAPVPPQQPPKPQIKKDPYMNIDTNRQSQKKKMTNEQTQTDPQKKEQPSPNLPNPPNPPSPSPHNNPSPNPSPPSNKVVIQRYKKQNVRIDSTSLKTLLREKISQFNNINIRFQDIPIIDLDDLYEAKQKYLESSRDILVKLNQLAGDRAGTTLTYKIFQSSQKKQIHWPDI